MISIEEAISIIGNNKFALETEVIPLTEADGRVLNEDIAAPRHSPRCTNSAMDGFAVKWEDVVPASIDKPVVLQIIGESRAGIPFEGTVLPGQAIRISTGAMLPSDVDTIIRIEDTERNFDKVTILRAKSFQQYVRQAGEELQGGDLLLRKGTELFPPHLALLASVGVFKVPVFRKAKVALVVTGNELMPIGQPAAPHQTWDSNTLMLSTAIRQDGGEVTYTGQVEDCLEAITAVIRKVAVHNNILIFSGGVSVGTHDHVQEATEQAGFLRLFWKVHQKPGMPLLCAKRDNTLLFGLPGNPVSAFMTYIYYIKPLIWRMQGKEFAWNIIKARLEDTITNVHDRKFFFRVVISKQMDGQKVVRGYQNQDSHILSSVALSDGFIIINNESTVPKGSWVDVYLFPWKTNCT